MKEAQTPSGSSLWLESISILWYMRRRGGSGWVVGGKWGWLIAILKRGVVQGGRQGQRREKIYTLTKGERSEGCVCVWGEESTKKDMGHNYCRDSFSEPPPTRHTLTDIVTEPSHLFKDDLKRDYKRGPDFSTVAPLLWWHKIESLPLSLSFSLSPSYGQIIKSAHRCSPEHSGRLNVRLLVLLVLWRLKCT